MAHDEFPPLTEQAKHVLMSTVKDIDVSKPYWDRRFAAAVIREAMTQTGFWKVGKKFTKVVRAIELEAIADNLHTLPPPPPTRQQMEEALRSLLNSLDCHPGSQSAQEAAILAAGIAHHCKVQP